MCLNISVHLWVHLSARKYIINSFFIFLQTQNVGKIGGGLKEMFISSSPIRSCKGQMVTFVLVMLWCSCLWIPYHIWLLSIFLYLQKLTYPYKKKLMLLLWCPRAEKSPLKSNYISMVSKTLAQPDTGQSRFKMNLLSEIVVLVRSMNMFKKGLIVLSGSRWCCEDQSYYSLCSLLLLWGKYYITDSMSPAWL